MTQWTLETACELPWCGGWILDFGGGEYVREEGNIDADLRMSKDCVTFQIVSPKPLTLTWRPGVDDPATAFSLDFCSVEPGSAK